MCNVTVTDIPLNRYKRNFSIDCGLSESLLDPWVPQGFGGAGEKGYLFSGSWGTLLIILGELGSKHIILGI